jgi:hypothetical protein
MVFWAFREFDHSQLQPRNGFTKTFSATLLTDFRFGYFKYNPVTAKPDGGTPMTDFEFLNANTGDPKTEGLGSFQLGKDQYQRIQRCARKRRPGPRHLKFW